MKRHLLLLGIIIIGFVGCGGPVFADQFCVYQDAKGVLVMSNVDCAPQHRAQRREQPAQLAKAFAQISTATKYFDTLTKAIKTQQQLNYLKYGPNWRDKI